MHRNLELTIAGALVATAAAANACPGTVTSLAKGEGLQLAMLYQTTNRVTSSSSSTTRNSSTNTVRSGSTNTSSSSSSSTNTSTNSSSNSSTNTTNTQVPPPL